MRALRAHRRDLAPPGAGEFEQADADVAEIGRAAAPRARRRPAPASTAPDWCARPRAAVRQQAQCQPADRGAQRALQRPGQACQRHAQADAQPDRPVARGERGAVGRESKSCGDSSEVMRCRGLRAWPRAGQLRYPCTHAGRSHRTRAARPVFGRAVPACAGHAVPPGLARLPPARLPAALGRALRRLPAKPCPRRRCGCMRCRWARSTRRRRW